MTIKLSKEELVSKISILSKICSGCSTNPILNTILFNVKNNTIELVAYNLEIGCCTNIKNENNNDDEFSFTINAAFFMNCLSKAPAKSVINMEIEKATEKVNISYNNGKVKYSTSYLPAEEFPELPTIKKSQDFTKIKVEKFIKGIDNTLYCVSSDKNFTKSPGLNISVNKEHVMFEAVDGYRLCKWETESDYDGENFDGETESDYDGENFDAIVSKNNAKYIRDIAFKEFDKDDDVIEITKNSKHIIFSLYNYTIISRICFGDKFDFTNFIPKKCDTKVKINRSALESALNCISPIIENAARNPVIAKIDETGINLKTISNLGKSEIFAEIIEFEGKSINKIGFNATFMIEALKNMSVDEVEIEFTSPLSPILIYNSENRSNFAMVLPLRTK